MLIAFLLIVTFGSLALSAGLLTYVLRLTREERDRSDARAAALEQALRAQVPLERWAPDLNLGSAAAAHDHAQLPPEPSVSADPPFVSDTDPPFGSDTYESRPEVFSQTFDATAERGRRPYRSLATAAIGVLVIGVVGGLALGVVSARNRISTTMQAAQSAAAPLELVSLKHERSGSSLVISGVVRNPQDGRPVNGLAAVAFLFDHAGNYVSSGRSALDYTQLHPGDESPFSISVPSAAGVSRYRITFRTDAGIVPHVDRRTDPPVVPAASR
jgi:hypothetical protein